MVNYLYGWHCSGELKGWALFISVTLPLIINCVVVFLLAEGSTPQTSDEERSFESDSDNTETHTKPFKLRLYEQLKDSLPVDSV